MKRSLPAPLLLLISLLVLFVLCPPVAFSQTIHISDTINIYTPVTGLDTVNCPAKVTVGSSAGFIVGDSVLIIQMKGANFDSTNTATFGTPIALNGAGSYE